MRSRSTFGDEPTDLGLGIAFGAAQVAQVAQFELDFVVAGRGLESASDDQLDAAFQLAYRERAAEPDCRARQRTVDSLISEFVRRGRLPPLGNNDLAVGDAFLAKVAILTEAEADELLDAICRNYLQSLARHSE